MNRLLTLLLVVFAVQLLQAQQWQLHNPTFGFDINSVDILGPGIIVVGGGQEQLDSFQIMFNTNNYGVTWTENPNDGLLPWNKSIAFYDQQNGFGAGNDGRIIKTNDGGNTWDNGTYPVNRDFNKIINIDALTYVIVGGNQSSDSVQTIVKTTDGGANWQVLYDQPGPWLKSVYFTTATKGIAVGESGVILSTTDGGSVWTPVTPPVVRDFNGITFLNADTGYIVGGSVSGNRTILRSDNGGASWSVVMDTTGGALNDLSFADSLIGYAVGDSATVLKTTDGGINWTAEEVDVNLTGNEQFRAVKFYDENFGAIAGKAGVFYLYNLPPPYSTFQTLQVSASSFTTVTLSGVVDSITVPMDLFFEYDSTLALSNSVQATPALINDTLLHYVAAYVNNLQPHTVYHYRLKGVSGTTTYYGNTLTFYTTAISSDSIFQTIAATHVTDTAATLNGIITGYSAIDTLTVSFQYGPTEVFGRETAATLLTVNDTLSYPVSAVVSGLSPDTVFYYYRLKVVTGSTTFFGNIRKLHTGLSEVPNWDFKLWQTQTTLLPSSWYVSSDYFERAEGHSGNYALQLTGPSMVFLGLPAKPDIICGAGFNARPDTLSVYLKYDVEVGDTAFAGIYLTKNGDEVAPFVAFPVTGNSGGGFERWAFPITYNSSLIPDSITLFFSASNPFFINTNPFHTPDTVYMLSTLTVDDIAFTPSDTNVPNNGFENWFSYTVEKPEGWISESYIIDSADINQVPMVSKQLLNVTDDYALLLKNIEVGGYLRRGHIATCENFFKNTPDFPISHKYHSFNGYYQYLPENGDSMLLEITFKKGGRYGKIIAVAKKTFSQPVTEFTPLDLKMNYQTDYNLLDTLMPDWASISINTFDEVPKGYSKLILDKLRFDGFAGADSIALSIENPPAAAFNESEIRVYPNPARDRFTVELSDEAAKQAGVIRLYTFSGQLLYELKPAPGETRLSLSVASMPAGIYLLRWEGSQKVSTKKIVVAR